MAVERLCQLVSLLYILNRPVTETHLVFVFPPRQTKGTGPMFISQQVLSFAGVKSLIS